MGEVVNLRIARKRKARDERDRAAEENRVRHGRTRTERLTVDAAGEQARRTHEAHRRERPQAGGEDDAGRS